MAAALDPHSYDPKNKGVPPQIVAGRFPPQPGKGVVRTNLFIPAPYVLNGPTDLGDMWKLRWWPGNYGDNRGPSPNADAEASRVSVFVDYEHGIVVTRQNPTVNIDGQHGGAKADFPNAHAVVASDGRLTLNYNCTDAYEPEIGKWADWSVNGKITLTPHADGTVSVGGNTTVYPSMETYQYRDGHPPAQIQWDPATDGGPKGPGLNLGSHHWVGDANPGLRPDIPHWKWELENLNPLPGFDPFNDNSTQLSDPMKPGGIPEISRGV